MCGHDDSTLPPGPVHPLEHIARTREWCRREPACVVGVLRSGSPGRGPHSRAGHRHGPMTAGDTWVGTMPPHRPTRNRMTRSAVSRGAATGQSVSDVPLTIADRGLATASGCRKVTVVLKLYALQSIIKGKIHGVPARSDSWQHFHHSPSCNRHVLGLPRPPRNKPQVLPVARFRRGDRPRRVQPCCRMSRSIVRRVAALCTPRRSDSHQMASAPCPARAVRQASARAKLQ